MHLEAAAKEQRPASGSRAGHACSLTGFTADPRLLVRPLNHARHFGLSAPYWVPTKK
ncbi:hypothetical protein HDV62DRAFT_287538 [Trichoderma sp. SZMC 28011]